jgi:hypothetical protein
MSRKRRLELALAVSLTGVGLSACQLSGEVGKAGGPSSGTGGGNTPSGGDTGSGGQGTGNSPGGGNSGGGTSGGGTGGIVSTMSNVPLFPARVRRLTNAEYDASVQALLGTSQTPAAKTFPPDSRQSGYTVNDNQIVSSVLASQLDATAQALVAEARQNGRLANLAPCSNPTSGGAACAKTFIQSFGAKAYRRALTDAEVTSMTTLYNTAVTGDTGTSPYNDGIDFVARAMLQSSGFLYVTELGSGSGDKIPLTANEIASSMAYLLTSAPPDATLLQAASSGALATPEGREKEARRLLQQPAAQLRVVRLLREWLGIDGIGSVAKDTQVYPNFSNYRAAMDAESQSFIKEVVFNSTGTVSELLSADWTTIASDAGISSGDVTNYYRGFYDVAQLAPSGHQPLAGTAGSAARLGILNQGAFPAVYAHAGQSAPVKRGVAVMRRVACLPVQDPVSLNIMVVPPVPDPNKPVTTRDLFAAHPKDAVCATCHNTIDALGFTFEQLDAAGAYRDGMEKVVSASGTSMLPVNTATTVKSTGTSLDGDYTDSNALAKALAQSPAVAECVARHLFRGSMGRSDNSVSATEDAFIKNDWSGLSADKKTNFLEILVTLMRSTIFTQRRPS